LKNTIGGYFLPHSVFSLCTAVLQAYRMSCATLRELRVAFLTL